MIKNPPKNCWTLKMFVVNSIEQDTVLVSVIKQGKINACIVLLVIAILLPRHVRNKLKCNLAPLIWSVVGVIGVTQRMAAAIWAAFEWVHKGGQLCCAISNAARRMIAVLEYPGDSPLHILLRNFHENLNFHSYLNSHGPNLYFKNFIY